MLALVPAATGGTFSPYLFLFLGVLILLSGALHLGPHLSSVRPFPDSILLRSRWFPLAWTSLVEVRFATPQLARPLSSIGSEMLLMTDPEKVLGYLPMRVTAFSGHGADKKVVQKLEPIARSLAAKGAFVLPLDAKEAASRLSWSLKQVDLALEYDKNGVVSLNSTPCDALVLKPEGHLLRSASGYVTVQRAKGDAATLPSGGRKLRSQPLLWEALEVLAEKYQVKEADGLTSFLSSVCATRGEGLGERLVSEGRDGNGKVLVSSLGATQVELSRPQLRAIVMAMAELEVDLDMEELRRVGLVMGALAAAREEEVLSTCRQILDEVFSDSKGHVFTEALLHAPRPASLCETAAMCNRGKRSVLPYGGLRKVIERLSGVGILVNRGTPEKPRYSLDRNDFRVRALARTYGPVRFEGDGGG